jgi:hypothetical protein
MALSPNGARPSRRLMCITIRPTVLARPRWASRVWTSRPFDRVIAYEKRCTSSATSIQTISRSKPSTFLGLAAGYATPNDTVCRSRSRQPPPGCGKKANHPRRSLLDHCYDYLHNQRGLAAAQSYASIAPWVLAPAHAVAHLRVWAWGNRSPRIEFRREAGAHTQPCAIAMPPNQEELRTGLHGLFCCRRPGELRRKGCRSCGEGAKDKSN